MALIVEAKDHATDSAKTSNVSRDVWSLLGYSLPIVGGMPRLLEFEAIYETFEKTLKLHPEFHDADIKFLSPTEQQDPLEVMFHRANTLLKLIRNLEKKPPSQKFLPVEEYSSSINAALSQQTKPPPLYSEMSHEERVEYTIRNYRRHIFVDPTSDDTPDQEVLPSRREEPDQESAAQISTVNNDILHTQESAESPFEDSNSDWVCGADPNSYPCTGPLEARTIGEELVSLREDAYSEIKTVTPKVLYGITKSLCNLIGKTQADLGKDPATFRALCNEVSSSDTFKNNFNLRLVVDGILDDSSKKPLKTVHLGMMDKLIHKIKPTDIHQLQYDIIHWVFKVGDTISKRYQKLSPSYNDGTLHASLLKFAQGGRDGDKLVVGKYYIPRDLIFEYGEAAVDGKIMQEPLWTDENPQQPSTTTTTNPTPSPYDVWN